jgi:hypothetical protein
MSSPGTYSRCSANSTEAAGQARKLVCPGFDQNSTYVNQLLDAFVPTNPYADTERVLNWAEAILGTLFHPAATSQAGFGYWYRCYAPTGLCLGVRLPDIYYFDGRFINRVGTVDDFLPQARAAGF